MKIRTSSWSAHARLSGAFAGLGPPDADRDSRSDIDVAFWWSAQSARDSDGHRQRPQAAPQLEYQPLHHRLLQGADRRLVENVCSASAFPGAGAHRFAGVVWDAFVPGDARIPDPG